MVVAGANAATHSLLNALHLSKKLWPRAVEHGHFHALA
jgi:hypothetical protein